MADEDEREDDEQYEAAAAAAAAAVAALAALIGDDVDRALDITDEERRVALLSALAAQSFTLAYEQAGGSGSSAEAARAYVYSLRPAFGLLQPDGTDEQQQRMTEIISHSAVSAATIAAAVDAAGPDDDVKFEWRTMRDDRVRELHRPVDGQMRAAGDPFDVGGQPLLYPGHPIGTPEHWINCRCYLISSSALTAASDKPWSQFSASDYDIGQWKRACCLTMPGGDPESKSTYKLPIREPGGALNSNGVHAAAARVNQVDAPPEAIAKAKAKIRGAYRQIGEEAPDVLKADALLAWGPSTSPPGTHDAPGWITNPKETQRLRTYWTKGAGAAKIGWGSPGDLTRCAKHLGKYVLPNHVWGTCQNLHYEALGYWNPESKPGGRSAAIDFDEINDNIAAVFAAATDLEVDMTDTLITPPREWFTDPGFDAPTPLTVTDDGEVLGHIGTWEQCHVGFGEDNCVPPPHSTRDYHHFRTGYVRTAGGDVAVGNLTLGTGHAPKTDGATAAVAHYDNTGTAVADVAAGEDDHGIWVHGMLRPGVTPEQVHALRAGTVSGDWRTLGGQYELVAALVVNVPGFPIPRSAETLAAGGEPLSLVAAGIIQVDPNAVEADRIAVAVLAHLDQREADKARRERAQALTAQITSLRVEARLRQYGDTMSEMTNITDFDPVSGTTTTTLVAAHDRSPLEWAARQKGGEENEPMTPGGGGGTPPVDPSITSLAPATGVVGTQVTVVVTGTNFDAGSKVEVDQTEVPTVFTSATSLSATYTPAAAGTKQVTVRHSNGEESNNSPFTVTAAAAADEQTAKKKAD